MKKLLITLLLSCFIWNPAALAGERPAVHIYLDADRSNAVESGESIERGIRVALAEEGNQLGGYPVELIIADHRGSTPRSLRNLKSYLADERALALFTGMHSPPLLANLAFINQQKILTLDPWAAAGPITRYPDGENWVFRLSVDDTKAGEVITQHAVDVEGFSKPYLLLEETGWGRSNERTMTAALRKRGIEAVGLEWFNWSLGENAAKSILRRARDSGADVIFMVANAPEGKTIARAMLSLDLNYRMPIRSHWGITGGDFALEIGPEQRQNLDLKFIQTRFSFLNSTQSSHAQSVLQRTKNMYEDVNSASDISAPAGFIHAYDMTRLLIQAVKDVGLSGNARADRAVVRNAMEVINTPVVGLIKRYEKPFAAFSAATPDAHEALGSEDMVMAVYGENNEILLVQE